LGGVVTGQLRWWGYVQKGDDGIVRGENKQAGDVGKKNSKLEICEELREVLVGEKQMKWDEKASLDELSLALV